MSSISGPGTSACHGHALPPPAQKNPLICVSHVSVLIDIHTYTHKHKVHEHGEETGGQQVMELGLKDGYVCMEYGSGRINAPMQ